MIVKIDIPHDAHPLLKKGQKVKIGDPFYATTSEEDAIISFVKELGIKAQDIFRYTKIVIGDTINIGDIVGEKKKLLGKKTLVSNVAGKVKHIDYSTGNLVVSTASAHENTTSAFFAGEVTNISEEGTFIEVDIGKAHEYKASGKADCGGMLSKLSDKDFYSYSADEIVDKMILIHSLQSHIEAKTDALGASGILYVEGDTTDTIPTVKIDESVFEALTTSKDIYMLFTTHEGKLFGYN